MASGDLTSSKQPKIWTGLYLCIVAMTLFVSITSHSINSGSPLYVQQIGAASFYGGLLVSAFNISTLISRVASGALADALSRKKLIVLGGLALVVGALISIFIPTMAAQIVARVFQGFGFATIHTSVTTAAAEILPKERLGEGIGYLGLGTAIGTAIGPSIAFWLTSLPFTEAFGCGLAAAAVTILMLSIPVRYEKNPDSLPPTSAYRTTLDKEKRGSSSKTPNVEVVNDSSSVQTSRDAKGPTSFVKNFISRFFEKAALRGAIPMFMATLGLAIFFTFNTLYARDMGYANPSYFYIIAAIVSLVLRLTVSRLLDSVNPFVLHAIALASGIVTLLGVCFIHNEVVFWFLGIGYGVCSGLIIPLLNAVSIKASPVDRYAPASACFYFFFDIGVALSALLWGFIIDGFGYVPMFIGGSIFFVLSFISALFAFPKKEKR